LVIKVQLNLKI